MNIAIIGFGLGGAHALKTIIEHKNYDENIHIHIFERNEELAVGLAYGKDTDYKLINMEDAYMSLEMFNPDHIYDWLVNNSEIDYRIEGMLPRIVYGQYIKDTYEKYLDNINVSIHQDGVIDITSIDGAYYIKGENKDYDICFSKVILSIGQSYYKDSYKLKGEDDFIYNPYPLEEKLDKLPADKKIGIIGAGPTSVDIYRYLKKFNNLTHPLYFITQKDGFMPVQIPFDLSKNICSIDNKWIDDNLDNNGIISLDKVISQVQEDFNKHGVSFNEVYDRYKDTDLESYRNAMRENDRDLGFCQIYTMELWAVAARLYNSLNGLGRLKVDDEYLEKISLLIAKTPILTMDKILADYDEGKLQIIRDTKDITKNDNTYTVTSEGNEDLSLVILINAQGFQTNLLKAVKVDSLLASLYDRNYIEEDIDGEFIRLTYPAYHPISSKYGVMEDFYVSGMWAGSTDISNNDVRSIIVANECIANNLMEKYKK